MFAITMIYKNPLFTNLWARSKDGYSKKQSQWFTCDLGKGDSREVEANNARVLFLHEIADCLDGSGVLAEHEQEVRIAWFAKIINTEILLHSSFSDLQVRNDSHPCSVMRHKRS